MKKVLTIAGSDCSGGAGIQADLKTIAAHGLYGMSVISALTAQNTMGVSDLMGLPADFVALQIDAIFDDLPPDAIKIGMLFSPNTIAAVSNRLRDYNARNIVLDPVMQATSGDRLVLTPATDALIKYILPITTLITPNLDEAGALCGFPVQTREDMRRAAHAIAPQTGGGVLIKGGHLPDCADDFLLYEDEEFWYPSPRIENPNTHGTGCTLSSAIACRLAEGLPLPECVAKAKLYICSALRAGLDLGSGRGPLQHNVPLE